jgi:hypothetical protein
VVGPVEQKHCYGNIQAHQSASRSDIVRNMEGALMMGFTPHGGMGR